MRARQPYRGQGSCSRRLRPPEQLAFVDSICNRTGNAASGCTKLRQFRVGLCCAASMLAGLCNRQPILVDWAESGQIQRRPVEGLRERVGVYLRASKLHLHSCPGEYAQQTLLATASRQCDGDCNATVT